MKKPNSFYVVYPFNENLRDILNSLKLIADDNQRTEAHITVRGPYLKKLSQNDLNKFSSIISNESLFINKVENFFDFNQNTVFFSCEENEILKSIWKKISYNDFRPHITIYDGEDRNYALKIFETLKKSFKPFDFKVSELSYLEPKSKYPIGFYNLKNIYKYDFLNDLNLNEKINLDLEILTKTDRIKLIEEISNKLYDNQWLQDFEKIF